MIHNIVKIISLDDFYTQEEALKLNSVVCNLKYEESELGKEIKDFNLIPEDIDKTFSNILNTNIITKKEISGVFKYPYSFIHFESFETNNEWIFVVALDETMLNIYENKNGPKTALDEYKLQYRNLHEWDLIVSYMLKPGQAIMFRPWLFHSFSGGLVQQFRLEEINA
jgi:hypothetical protein